MLAVPELPPAIRELQERAVSFVREEVHPVEERTAKRGEIDRDELAELYRKARSAGFVNYNMPIEVGGQDLPMLGQVALEEVAGHATNGLGFMVAGRGPRELLDIASPDQVERYLLPVLRAEAHEAWAITEPHAAGSDVNAIQATAVRDGDRWRLNGEKWYVTGGDRASFFLVLAWAEGEQTLFIVDREAAGLAIVRAPRFMHDP